MTDSKVEPPERSSRLRSGQLETIAKLLCMNANSPEQVAETVGISVERLKGFMDGRNKTFNTFYEKYRAIVDQHHTGAMMNMIEMMPKAHAAVDRGLDSVDTKLAVDTAFKLYERVIPVKKEHTAGPDVAVNVTFGNAQAAGILSESVVNVGVTLVELRSHMEKEVTLSHELVGEAALPVPPGQLEVSDGEALPLPEDATDALQLIPMPDERHT